jgi:CRP/FNR family transcriptional regulator, cyclic AMP receptor protein
LGREPYRRPPTRRLFVPSNARLGCAGQEKHGYCEHRRGTVVGKTKPKVKLEDVLGLVPVFRGLSRRQLRHLAGLCEVADYMADHSIVRQGDPGESFYVVLDGQGKVTVRRRFVSRLLPGDHFGEIALLDGGPRTATVTSETPMTLAILQRQDFTKALREDGELAYAIARELALMFRRLSNSANQ